jgi:hypothetical protein
MTLSINPVAPVSTIAAPPAVEGPALQPGTVVSAQVMKLLQADLVRIAISGMTLDLPTTLPLQPGQTLQLAVGQNQNGLTLTPVALPGSGDLPAAKTAALDGRGAAVTVDDLPASVAPSIAPQAPSKSQPLLSPQQQAAVTAATQMAVTKQAGLSPLFANLSTAVASGQLPQPVLLAAAQLLSLRVPRDQPLSGADIKAALSASGLLAEASRAGTSAPLPDMKAALMVLRQTLSTWLASTEANQPTTPQAGARPAMAAALASESGDADPVKALLTQALALNAARTEHGQQAPLPAPSSRLLPPPPFRDALPAAQTIALPSLVPDSEPSTVAQQLIGDTDKALARQTLLQIASLPDQAAAARNDPTQPRWNFEIPFMTQQGTAMAQFEIARDGSGPETEAGSRVWRARFSIDIEPAGPVHALISFSGGNTSVKMWAERATTAATLRASAQQLGQSLDRAALKIGDIVIADGAPISATRPRAGHFVNRAT